MKVTCDITEFGAKIGLNKRWQDLLNARGGDITEVGVKSTFN